MTPCQSPAAVHASARCMRQDFSSLNRQAVANHTTQRFLSACGCKSSMVVLCDNNDLHIPIPSAPKHERLTRCPGSVRRRAELQVQHARAAVGWLRLSYPPAPEGVDSASVSKTATFGCWRTDQHSSVEPAPWAWSARQQLADCWWISWQPFLEPATETHDHSEEQHSIFSITYKVQEALKQST